MSAPSSLPASLYTIESAIVELYLLRDEAEHEGDAQAIAVIDEQIAEWAKSELRKVDGIASWIRECEARAEIAENESKRLKDRAKEWQAKADRVREAALRAMQEHRAKRLEGKSSTLRIQANGGKQALELSDHIGELPAEYLTATVTMPMPLWRALQQSCANGNAPLGVALLIHETGVDKAKLRTALTQQIICPECSHRGTVVLGEDMNWKETCPRCEGKGTIPNSIPGAKLKERGVSLHIL